MELTDKYLKKAMAYIADNDPKFYAKLTQEMKEEERFHNFISEEDATGIASAFKNTDGTTGAKWNPSTLFSKVEELGGMTECEPFYNKWALWLTMNMESSDHSRVLEKWSEGDANRYAEACYDLAVSQLSDKDRPHWLREYFSI